MLLQSASRGDGDAPGNPGYTCCSFHSGNQIGQKIAACLVTLAGRTRWGGVSAGKETQG